MMFELIIWKKLKVKGIKLQYGLKESTRKTNYALYTKGIDQSLCLKTNVRKHFPPAYINDL